MSDVSSNTTTMYGVQQQTNAMKMMKTVFTRRIASIVAMKTALCATCIKANKNAVIVTTTTKTTMIMTITHRRLIRPIITDDLT